MLWQAEALSRFFNIPGRGGFVFFMTDYTEEGIPSFNYAREAACLSLEKTLDEMQGKENITEIMFRDSWFKNMSDSFDVFADGWYSPPPKGMAVLSEGRVNFDSLRNPYNWSDDTVIDWDGVLYAYASPVDRKNGYIGDISVTLYFGHNEKIIDHVKNCHEATMAVFERMSEAETAGDLFRISQNVFEQYHLKSTVISRTDNMPINLGHTFPYVMNVSEKDILSEEDKLSVSRSGTARQHVSIPLQGEPAEGSDYQLVVAHFRPSL